MMLEGRGLWKTFDGFSAVSGVDLAVQERAVHALIGPNGAGKTTLFNLLSGHLLPNKGSVLFAGRDITHVPPHIRCIQGIARSFQRTHIFPKLTVFENVQAALLSRQQRWFHLYRPVRGMSRDAVAEILDEVGLAAQSAMLAGELAYGDQKRLELGIVLALQPRMLLLDEPTAGMAPQEKHGTLDLVGRIVRQRGLTLLFTEHDMDVVFSIADRITVLHHGRVIAEGEPAEVRGNDEVQRVYFGGTEWPWKSSESTATTG